jgi:hypothetical protein
MRAWKSSARVIRPSIIARWKKAECCGEKKKEKRKRRKVG